MVSDQTLNDIDLVTLWIFLVCLQGRVYIFVHVFNRLSDAGHPRNIKYGKLSKGHKNILCISLKLNFYNFRLCLEENKVEVCFFPNKNINVMQHIKKGDSVAGEVNFEFFFYLILVELFCSFKMTPHTNETGPLPLCTFSVMGLSMRSSIFSKSSPVRSKSGIINELSAFPNCVPTVRCGYTSSSWHGHTGHAYCICFVGKH